MSETLDDPIQMLHAMGRAYWSAVLCASGSEKGRELFREADNPEVGDWVMETSTAYFVADGQREARDAIGIMLRKTSGGAVIRTIDGRVFNWDNAGFIKLPIPIGVQAES